MKHKPPVAMPLVLATLLCGSAAVRTTAAPPLQTLGIISVRDFGAKGDGKTLDTAALNRAIEACAKAGGGTVVVPPGKYRTGTVLLQSHITLEIMSGATLLASEDPNDYPLEPDAYDPKKLIRSPLINAHDAENITL